MLPLISTIFYTRTTTIVKELSNIIEINDKVELTPIKISYIGGIICMRSCGSKEFTKEAILFTLKQFAAVSQANEMHGLCRDDCEALVKHSKILHVQIMPPI